ncbi:MAG: DNA polymerase III subunit [Kiritimatiellia bacterium]|nr:DNA polymerase III subunit [Kiritimatiellia bacterium]MDP6848431.1 DNA polymerase III subunit [Kiritimatiellia bacterium]
MNITAAYELLKNAFASGRAAHAYILAGPPRGSCQAVTEKVLQLLFCESGEACGECRGCQRVVEHSHSDVLWVEPEKKSRIISIDQVRNLQTRVFQTSFEGGWRSCVIVAADRLGQEAANAFLKTLEEPPERCVFFLLTDSPQSLLPTILSRCQHLRLGGEKEELPDDVEARLVEILSMTGENGSLGALGQADAMKALLKDIKTAVEEGEAELAEEEATAHEKDVLDARVGARFREVRTSLVRFVMLWFRDVLMLLCDADALVYNTRHIEAIRKRAAAVSLSQAMKDLAMIEEMHRRLERNVNDAVVFSLLFTSLE